MAQIQGGEFKIITTARLMAVDFKGGVEFQRYEGRSSKTRVVWRFEHAVAVVAEMLELMEQRLNAMRTEHQRTWTFPRVFFVVDEFAQIQLWPTTTGKRERLMKASSRASRSWPCLGARWAS